MGQCQGTDGQDGDETQWEVESVQKTEQRVFSILACTFESPGELYKLMHVQVSPYQIQNELIWGKDRVSAVEKISQALTIRAEDYHLIRCYMARSLASCPPSLLSLEQQALNTLPFLSTSQGFSPPTHALSFTQIVTPSDSRDLPQPHTNLSGMSSLILLQQCLFLNQIVQSYIFIFVLFVYLLIYFSTVRANVIAHFHHCYISQYLVQYACHILGTK